MQKSYPFDNIKYDSSYPKLLHATRTSGVYSADTHFLCTPTTGMQIQVSPGLFWMHLDEFEGAVFGSTEVEYFNIDTADGMLPRIDLLTIRRDEVENNTYMYIKKGTPTSGATAQSYVNNLYTTLQFDAEAKEWALYGIRVDAGMTNISLSNIIDLRLNENFCGIMRDGVTAIPTQALYDAWWEWFESHEESAKDKLDELTDWIELFQTQADSSFDEWMRENSDIFERFYNSAREKNDAFFEEQSDGFTVWFEQIKGILGEDVAGNLANEIMDIKSYLPTSLIAKFPVDTPLQSYHLFRVFNGIRAPLEEWGFQNAVVQELPLLYTIDHNANDIAVYTIPQFSGRLWRVTHVNPFETVLDSNQYFLKLVGRC